VRPAVAIIYSPWGRQSGAHLNPAVTLTFLRLGKVAPADALFYVLAQFTGGAAGTLLMAAALGDRFTLPPISAVATLPGRPGELVAFGAEIAIAFILMSTLRLGGKTPCAKLNHFTKRRCIFHCKCSPPTPRRA